ncbi:MAG: ABC transporter ATP-binding protein [Bacteroidales bacterium]|nr:ABC transporter ATP-binding protein [Bacteroidales bacterium]
MPEINNKRSEYAISTQGLKFAYGNRPVLEGFDLNVPSGSIFGFLGPNGAGKSTTIKAILGLLQVKPGMVNVFGMEFHSNSMAILQKTGAMVESPSQYEHLSARRNLEITRLLRQLPTSRIAEVLNIVGLENEADRPVKQFSTGMKQRLSLAIALLGKPELLILDEPINGLDPSGIIEIRNLINRLNTEEGCTVFLSSHILDEIEKICSHVAVINKGKLLYQGDTSGLVSRYKGQDSLIIQCNQAVKALEILGSGSLLASKDGISIPWPGREETAGLLKKLFEQGIDIYTVQKEQNDLESSFLEILQEGGKA